jgi:Flavivirus DEAD domain
MLKIVEDHYGTKHTRKYIIKAIKAGNHQRVYALGPTRVVTWEIYVCKTKEALTRCPQEQATPLMRKE